MLVLVVLRSRYVVVHDGDVGVAAVVAGVGVCDDVADDADGDGCVGGGVVIGDVDWWYWWLWCWLWLCWCWWSGAYDDGVIDVGGDIDVGSVVVGVGGGGVGIDCDVYDAGCVVGVCDSWLCC